MKSKQIEAESKVIALEDGTFFIPIPDELVQKLGLKEGDQVYLNETQICDNIREYSGFTISKVEDEKK